MQRDSSVQEGYVLLDEPSRNLERLHKNDRMLYQPFFCTATGREFSLKFLEICACLSNGAQQLRSNTSLHIWTALWALIHTVPSIKPQIQKPYPSLLKKGATFIKTSCSNLCSQKRTGHIKMKSPYVCRATLKDF